MGFLELTDVAYRLPGGWTLFEGVTFRVPEGAHSALVGANGIGKTTLLRLIAGEEPPSAGSIRVDGRVGLMRQFIGSNEQPTTVRAFLLAYSDPAVREAAARLEQAERRLAADPDERAQLAYAEALAAWETAGGYRAEVLWDRCAAEAFGGGYPESATRPIETLSGGERKRLALEIVLRSPFDVVVLDEPDNTLDIAGKEWLESRIAEDPRTILFVSHDRTVLERAATQVVTLEGRATWTHPASFATYAEARDARVERLDEQHRRYDEERPMPKVQGIADQSDRDQQPAAKHPVHRSGRSPDQRRGAQGSGDIRQEGFGAEDRRCRRYRQDRGDAEKICPVS